MKPLAEMPSLEAAQLALVGPCSLDLEHRPVPLGFEFHHLIPVAWQLHTPNPSARPSPGPDPNGRGMLWDNRAVVCCRTSHGNVHHWIVAMMRALAANPDGAIPGAWAAAVPPAFKRTLTARAALLALDRAASCSVDLIGLTRIGEWGQI